MANFVENQEGVTEEIQDLGAGVFVPRPKLNFSNVFAYANASNAVATASLPAAGVGKRVVCTRIIGGFATNVTVGTVTISRGATIIAVLPFTGNFNFAFDVAPILSNDNEAINVAISAAGSAIVGHVAAFGFTPGY